MRDRIRCRLVGVRQVGAFMRGLRRQSSQRAGRNDVGSARLNRSSALGGFGFQRGFGPIGRGEGCSREESAGKYRPNRELNRAWMS
ncbi:hypothetical protein IEQ34_015511 [Dendrobium chrysotoxum]|uniref:Uncharacterized protein n=1 Tax=Dendrobium chrysotoxum TaxID=161865 RepID=A0AAV7GIN2_DENCH|nr:hypothetical protein IEQ34_015511 [Dendrobium chrysotoxum]